MIKLIKLGVSTDWSKGEYGYAYSLGIHQGDRLKVVFEDGHLGQLDETYGLYVSNKKIVLPKPLEELTKKEWKEIQYL